MPTASHPSTLVAHERSAGLGSRLVVNYQTGYGYPVDGNLDIRKLPPALRLLRRALFGASSALRYDVFHFNTGQTFFPMRFPLRFDLPLLKALGKRVFVTYQGCDARQPGYCAKSFELSCCTYGPCPCRQDLDDIKSRRIRHVQKWADGVFCLNPDLLHVVPEAEFVPYAGDWPEPVAPRSAAPSRPLRVVHAPTDRRKKGTDLLLQAIAESGLDVELDLVEGLPNQEALQRYRQADVVVDQLLLGWYGTLAAECMAMGKPVLAFVRRSDLAKIPSRMAEDLPVVDVSPTTVADALRRLAGDTSERQRLGERGIEYTKRWHAAEGISRRLVAMYRGEAECFWPEAEPERV